MKQWYEALFTNYAHKYEDECFTKGTLNEVDFIEKEINYKHELKILDIGCGTGRHSIELARRGYRVRGIDLSENMLNKARQKATDAKVDVEFIQADARDFCYNEAYDLIIMLCEGGFSLMETDEMNYRILQNAARSLKPGGKFIFSCLNALFALNNSTKELVEKDSDNIQNGAFDLMSFRDISTYEFTDDDGKRITLKTNERFYAPSEIKFMLELLNFSKVDILGCDVGDFTRDKALTINNFEMLAVAEK